VALTVLGVRFMRIGGETGSHWRGKDCDETRNDVYPGRRSTAYDSTIDHDCNGIAGVDAVRRPCGGARGTGRSRQWVVSHVCVACHACVQIPRAGYAGMR
jgi:hypothetical protein